MELWNVGSRYKLIMLNNQVYTAVVLSIDNTHIKVRDKNGNIRILGKTAIMESRKLIDEGGDYVDKRKG